MLIQRILQYSLRLMLVLAVAMVALSQHSRPVHAATITVNGDITSNTTWTADNVYVLTTDVQVLEGVRLTIEAGTVIKFQISTRLIVNGVLDARGTPTNPIVFTSFKDDTYGGDTNNDGSTSAPAPNDWGWIEFTDTSVDDQNFLEYCTILYGGKDYWSFNDHYLGAVYLSNASPTISHCTISHSGSYAIGMNTAASPTIADNTFTDNAVNGIGVFGGTVFANSTWTSTNYPYVLDGDIIIAEGASLTLSPGVVVKGRVNTRLIVNGVLDARGTPANPIVFTSFKDDTYGGDTNNDGSTSAPAPNDWGWIEFTDTSVDDQNFLEYCTILYGGKDYWSFNDHYLGAVYLSNASPTIRYNIITQNGHGIWVSGASFPYITGNAIYNNEGYGLYNGEKPLVVTAQNNWWGHESGPYDPSDDAGDPTHLYNPDGQGDQVDDYVDYAPWQGSPVSQPFIRVDNTAFLSDQGGQIHVTVPGGKPLSLAIPFDCNPTAVTATFAGNTVALSDADHDNIWTGVVSGVITDSQTLPITVTATGGTCDGSDWEVAQVTLIDPSGYVYNAVTGARIINATVTLYHYDTSQRDYVIWDAYSFGQVNPQQTDIQGNYGWDVPAGSYYITVHKSGYEDYQSSPVTVPPPVTDLNVALTPTGPIPPDFFIYLPIVLR